MSDVALTTFVGEIALGRMNIYVKDKIEKEIDDIVELERQKGAKPSEMNKSALSNELLRLGLMVYKAQDEESTFDLESYRRDLIKASTGAREAAMLLVGMMSDMYSRSLGEVNKDNLDDAIDKNYTIIHTAEEEIEARHFIKSE